MAEKTTNKSIVQQKRDVLIPVFMEAVRAKIMDIRGQKVIIDRDVAELYGVETKDINRAVKNNPDKFPNGYFFVLDDQEFKDLRLKIFTANQEMSDSERISLNRVRYNPVAFTEKGLYMLATILKSPQAVVTTLAIIETFAQVRELVRTMNEIQETTDETSQKSLMKRTGEIISNVIGSNMEAAGTETEFEINLAVFKMKHTIKKTKKDSK